MTPIILLERLAEFVEENISDIKLQVSAAWLNTSILMKFPDCLINHAFFLSSARSPFPHFSKSSNGGRLLPQKPFTVSCSSSLLNCLASSILFSFLRAHPQAGALRCLCCSTCCQIVADLYAAQ